MFVPTLQKIGTRKFRRFIVEHLPFQAVQELRQIVDVMYATSVEILETKKRALEEGDEAVERQVARGKDIMSILRMPINLSGFFWWPNFVFSAE